MFFQGYVLLLEWLVCTVCASIHVWLSSGNVFVDGVQGSISHTYHSYNVFIREHTSMHTYTYKYKLTHMYARVMQ